MNRILLILTISTLFASCKKDNEFENTFNGGNFYLEIIECGENESLTEDYIFKRNSNEIEIQFLNDCIFETFDYNINGAARIYRDSISLRIDRTESAKGEIAAVSDCVCLNKVKFKFDHSISKDVPITLNGYRIDK
ncbi:MAG: hypothetical protein K0R51_1101 [Cytophagaceae bacterium]|jgi:hypothetical protein|nr:hypothetical protein [Cytophagaceae bacterium]